MADERLPLRVKGEPDVPFPETVRPVVLPKAKVPWPTLRVSVRLSFPAPAVSVTLIALCA